MKPLLVRGKKTLPLSGNRNCSNNLLSGSADNKMSNTTSPVQSQSLKYGLLPYCLDADLRSHVQELIALAERTDAAGAMNPVILTTQNRELWLKWDRLRAEDEAVRDGLVGLFDLDHFKRINDAYGHDLGDEVLRSLVQLTRRLMRPTDGIARMGGEEFMLLPDADANRAWGVIDRLLEAFCHQRVMHQGSGQRVAATFSAGIAQWCVGEDFAGLYQRADTALLAAKQAGRHAPCTKSDKPHA